MKPEVLIKVDSVSKKFCLDLKTSLLYGVQDIFKDVLGNGGGHELRNKEFWALNNISFELRRGECLGLVGHNGAGKSTLLKVLHGLIKPDKGSVTYYGKMAALIELGAGFNPILTGRENVYINGQILGFSKIEMDEKFDEIVEFSEIGDFIDSPVRTYSSGMKVRLGFAIAAQMEPDILLIDEVLAVGDVGFRVKCLNRISELLKKCAVIFVSHSMPQVGKICTNAMLMQKGENVLSSVAVSEVIEKYFNMFDTESASEYGNGRCKLLNFKVIGLEKNNDTYIVDKMDVFHLNFELQIDVKYTKLYVIVQFHDIEMKTVANGVSLENSVIIENKGEKIVLDVKMPNLLSGGKYTISFNVFELKEGACEMQGDLVLSKRNMIKIYTRGYRLAYHCPVQLPSEWVVE